MVRQKFAPTALRLVGATLVMIGAVFFAARPAAAMSATDCDDADNTKVLKFQEQVGPGPSTVTVTAH